MILYALACGAASVVEAPSPTPAAATSPDLVLVGIAGLRGDSGTGAPEAFTAPFASRRPTVYTQAYAQSPSTYPSWGSILTGRYPSAIPLCGLPGDNAPGAEAGATAWCNTIPASTPTIPAVLGLYGYRTALVYTELPHASTYTGLFGDAIQVPAPTGRTDWAALGSAARTWWDADVTKPRLLVVATSDLLFRDRPDLMAAAGLDTLGAHEAPHIDPDRIRAAYVSAAAEAGKGAAGLVNGLQATRDTWSFVFGVHGMNLGDAPELWQVLRPDQPWNDILVDRTLHVPLLVLPPGTGTSARSDRLVELADLVPTLSRLGGAMPPANLPGTDLVAPAPEPAPTAYAEFGDMLAVRQGGWQYIVRAYFYNRSSLDPELTNFLLEPKLDADHHFLYDLWRDPKNEHNVVTAQVDIARQMHALLRALRTGPGSPPAGEMSDRRVWELRLTPSQGYW